MTVVLVFNCRFKYGLFSVPSELSVANISVLCALCGFAQKKPSVLFLSLSLTLTLSPCCFNLKSLIILYFQPFSKGLIITERGESKDMAVQMLEFKAEVRELLDLMIHSLYSHKEVFLRELISNASDAIDRLRYLSLTDSSVLEGLGEWTIRITPDKVAGTLTVSDNGIGMTRDEVISELGTIAHSGTKDFLRALQSKEAQANPDLIGQFGVGFYASFMVADRVTVLTRKAGEKGAEGVKWESAADGSFTVQDIGRDRSGTDVILHLKEDEKRFLEEWEIRNVVRKYSDYIEHPVVMETERVKPDEQDEKKQVTVREDEVLNSRKAIWLKDKSEITESEYNEFYKHISHDFLDPAKVIHYRAEGTSEFTALLYIPSKAPFGMFYKDFKIGPALYVNRVQIMNHCEELIPVYLRFVRGVVDSSDLPLNVSRETLQNNRQVEIIRKNVTKKVLDTLTEMKKGAYEQYLAFYGEFGKILKEGIHFDFSRRETIADLLLFPSSRTKPGEFTTFQAYIDGMTEGQDTIYYISGSKIDEALASPYLETFRDKDIEVLVMPDEIDDFIMGDLFEYKGKHFKSVLQGDISLDAAGAEALERDKGAYGDLIGLIRDALKEEVKDVRLSGRLKDSPCCLVTDEGALNPKMERILKAMGQEVPPMKRILEINAAHPLVETMNSILRKDSGSPLLGEFASILYDEALLLEGAQPRDPIAFAKTVARLMVEQGRHSLGSEGPQ